MYLSSSRQCDVRNGKTPIPAAEIAAGQAARAAVDLQVSRANAAYQQVLRRDWRSFVELGPNVALQVLNAPIGTPSDVFTGSAPPASGSGSSSAVSPGSPVGVDIMTGPSAAGDGGSSGPGGSENNSGEIRRRRRSGSATDARAFADTFGRLTPFKTYTGPLPSQGSVMSLVYGGSPSNRTATAGTNPPSTPNAAAGYWQGGGPCPSPAGVVSAPFGEPFPDTLAGGSSVGGSSYTWLWALLGLAGLAYIADKNDKKQRGTR